MGQFDRKLMMQLMAFVMAFSSASSTWAATSNAQPSDEDVTSHTPVPVASGVDVESKTLHFTMANPQDPEEQVEAEFQVDPAQINNLSDLRQNLISEEKVFHDFAVFLRTQLGLPAEMPDGITHMMFNMVPQKSQVEMKRQFLLRYKTTSQIFTSALKRTFGTSQHGFLAQTVLFGGAEGAVMLWECYKSIAYDPACMENLINGKTDPVGALSFSTFITANGFASDLMTNHLNLTNESNGKPRKLPLISRSTLPYLGMTAGMLVSNFSAELLGLMGKCAKSLMRDRQGDPNQAGYWEDEISSADKLKACDDAQKQFFSIEHMSEQYLPMLISMLSTTGILSKGTEEAAWLMRKAGQTAAVQTAVEKAGPKALLRMAADHTPAKLKILGARIGAQLTPLGWAVDTVTVLGIAQNLLQNAGFIYLDHHFTPALNKAWAQLWGKASWVEDASEKLKSFLLVNHETGWDASKNYDKSVAEFKARSAEANYRMGPVIQKFQEEMDSWRLANSAPIMKPLQDWAKIQSDVVREMGATQEFYNNFIPDVFDSFKFALKSSTKAGLNAIEKKQAIYSPFRNYPLWGVRPTEYDICRPDDDSQDKDNCFDGDLQLLTEYPDYMEKLQLQHIAETVELANQAIANRTVPPHYTDKIVTKLLILDSQNDDSKQPKKHFQYGVRNDERFLQQYAIEFPQTDVEFVQKILDGFKVTTRDATGKALEQLNSALRNSSSLNKKTVLFLNVLRAIIGNPAPQWAEGSLYTMLFETKMSTGVNKDTFHGFDRKSRPDFVFESFSEYLLYQMICGPDFENTDEVLKQTWGFKPKFIAPKVIKSGVYAEIEWPDAFLKDREAHNVQVHHNRVPFCHTGDYASFYLVYSSKIYVNGNSTPTTFMKFLSSNIDPRILGNWNNLADRSKSNYTNWWDRNIQASAVTLFSRLDLEYQKLIEGLTKALTQETYFEEGSLLDKVAKGALFAFNHNPFMPSNYNGKQTDASRAILTSSVQEMNVYLKILGDIELSLNRKSGAAKNDFIDAQKSLLSQMNAPFVVMTPSQKKFIDSLNVVITEVNGLHLAPPNEYYNLLKVSQKADAAEIRAGYDNAVAEILHRKDPQSDNSRHDLLNLKIAFDILSNPNLRKSYNQPKAMLTTSTVDFKTKATAMTEALTEYGKQLDQLSGLTNYQKETIEAAMTALQKVSTALTVYVFDTQLTKYSASASCQEKLLELQDMEKRMKAGNEK
jgi:hypothetical protein